jgi:uncharacterized protein YbjQ (UPF0145 family)
MILTTTENVHGREVAENLGLVLGSTVRAKHLGRDILAGLKGLVGGEVEQYTQLLQDARRMAIERMTEQAESLEADAIVTVRFVTNTVSPNMSELLAYGTAVKLTKP